MTPARLLARGVALFAIATWSFALAFAVGMATETADAASASRDASLPGPQLEQRRDEPRTSVEEVGATVMCPSCDTTLDQSNSAAAERMRAYVVAAVAAGWTADEIRDGLVEEYGGDESILAAPRAHGLGLVAWVVPGFVALVALVGGVVLMRRWRRGVRQSTSVASSGYSDDGSTPPSAAR